MKVIRNAVQDEYFSLVLLDSFEKENCHPDWLSACLRSHATV